MNACPEEKAAAQAQRWFSLVSPPDQSMGVPLDTQGQSPGLWEGAETRAVCVCATQTHWREHLHTWGTSGYCDTAGQN